MNKLLTTLKQFLEASPTREVVGDNNRHMCIYCGSTYEKHHSPDCLWLMLSKEYEEIENGSEGRCLDCKADIEWLSAPLTKEEKDAFGLAGKFVDEVK